MSSASSSLVSGAVMNLKATASAITSSIPEIRSGSTAAGGRNSCNARLAVAFGARLERVGIGDNDAAGLLVEVRRIRRFHDQPGLAGFELGDAERRACPAHVDLSGHGGGHGRGGIAGRRRLELDVVVLLQREHAGMGGGAVVGIGDGLAREVLWRPDRRVRW